MTSLPSVSVVCVTYNSAALLPDFVASLHAGMEGVPAWELVGVDNASSDGSAERLRALLPRATVLEAPNNGGFAAGVNCGLRRIDSERAVLVINPDARLHRSSVMQLLDELGRPRVGIVAPRLLEPDGTTFLSLHREPTVLRVLGAAVLGEKVAGRVAALGELMVGDEIYGNSQDVVWASGAVLMFAPGLVQHIGLLDESFFLYSEETEYALRARDAGYRVRYRPDAVAMHLGGDRHTVPQLYRMLIANKARLFARRHPRWRARLYRRAMIFHQGIRARLGHALADEGVSALRDRSLFDE